MIWRIREVLGLKAQSTTVRIRNAALPFDRAIQKISGIKLNSGLIGQDLQHAPTAGLIDFGRLRKLAAAVQHPVVIVAVALFQLIVVVVNSCAHSGRFAEIKRSSGDGCQLSGGNQFVVNRGVAAGVDLHLVLKDISVALPRQVEIRMVSQIYDCILVSRCRVVNFEIFADKCVANDCSQRSREPSIAVRAQRA